MSLELIICFCIFSVSAFILMVCYYFTKVKYRHTDDEPKLWGVKIKTIQGAMVIIAILAVCRIQYVLINSQSNSTQDYWSGWPLYMVICTILGFILILLGHAIGPIMRRIEPGGRFAERDYSVLIEGIFRLSGGFILILMLILREIQISL